MCEGCEVCEVCVRGVRCVSVYITAESARQPNLGCIIAIYDVSMSYVRVHAPRMGMRQQFQNLI